jgi:hypothetical protein
MPVWRANYRTRLSLQGARVKMKEFALAQDFAVLALATKGHANHSLPYGSVAIHGPAHVV